MSNQKITQKIGENCNFVTEKSLRKSIFTFQFQPSKTNFLAIKILHFPISNFTDQILILFFPVSKCFPLQDSRSTESQRKFFLFTTWKSYKSPFYYASSRFKKSTKICSTFYFLSKIAFSFFLTNFSNSFFFWHKVFGKGWTLILNFQLFEISIFT